MHDLTRVEVALIGAEPEGRLGFRGFHKKRPVEQGERTRKRERLKPAGHFGRMLQPVLHMVEPVGSPERLTIHNHERRPEHAIGNRPVERLVERLLGVFVVPGCLDFLHGKRHATRLARRVQLACRAHLFAGTEIPMIHRPRESLGQFGVLAVQPPEHQPVQARPIGGHLGREGHRQAVHLTQPGKILAVMGKLGRLLARRDRFVMRQNLGKRHTIPFDLSPITLGDTFNIVHRHIGIGRYKIEIESDGRSHGSSSWINGDRRSRPH